MSDKFFLELNTEDLHKELEEVERHREIVEANTEKTISFVTKSSAEAIAEVTALTRMSYNMMESVVRAAGGTIPPIMSGLISAAFSTISILTPLLTAQAMTPAGYAQSALGFLELGMTVSALVSAQMEEQEVAQKLAGARSVVSNISAMVGMMSFK